MSNREQQILRYAAAGLAGTVVHYCLLFLMLDSVGPVHASTSGAVVGATVNFFLARYWVFGERRNIQYPFPKFLIVGLTGLGVNAAILSLMILSLPVLASQLVATGCTFLTGYVLNDIWSFRERARQ